MSNGAASAERFARLFSDIPDTVVIAGVGKGRELERMRKMWPNAKLVGCEPVAENIAVLEQTGRITYLDKFVQCGLWSKNRRCTIDLKYEPDERASFFPFANGSLAGSISRKVRCLTLPALRRRTRPWPGKLLLWLDAEGAELEILKRVAEIRPEWVNVEVAWFSLRNRPLAREVEARMLSAGYRLFAIHSVVKNGRMGEAVFITRQRWRQIRDECIRRELVRKQDRYMRRLRMQRRRRLHKIRRNTLAAKDLRV